MRTLLLSFVTSRPRFSRTLARASTFPLEVGCALHTFISDTILLFLIDQPTLLYCDDGIRIKRGITRRQHYTCPFVPHQKEEATNFLLFLRHS